MKKRTLSLLLAIVLIAGLFPTLRMTAEAADVAISVSNFPDAHFRTFVKQYDKNSDNALSASELSAVTEMNCKSESISNLKGIEHFTALKTLNCANNQLTSLDISKNTKLTALICYTNQLTSLNVSANTALFHLDCDSNQLTALNVSSNTGLTLLRCSWNSIRTLNVSKNTKLKSLFCIDNNLISLDVSKNGALETLYCADNRITGLDLRMNPALIQLVCYNNELTTLDVSFNPALTYLDCSNNYISLSKVTLGRNDKLKTLNVSSNGKLKSLDVSKTPIIRDTIRKGTLTVDSYGKATYHREDSNVIADNNLDIFTGKSYPLKVGGIQVTDDNREDILGDGVFSFDGISTLTVKGTCTTDSYGIENGGIKGLRIKVLSNSSIITPSANAILLREDTTITGPGILRLESGGSGIYAVNNDVTLMLEEAQLNIDAYYGVTGPSGNNNTKLIVSHSSLIVSNAGGGAVVDFGGGITLKNCRIMTPTGGKISSNGRELQTPSGSLATKAVIAWSIRNNPFLDIKDTDSDCNAVLWAYYHSPIQITAGTDATHFSPTDTVTRGQAVTFIWNAVGRPAPAKTMNPFTDNKSGKYYYNAVLWAYYNDPQITNGTSATTFSPNQTCSRAQIITFLWNALGRPEPTISNPYSDVTPTKYYYRPALWAYENGIEKGSGGKFRPNTDCTRAAIVSYLYRYYTGYSLLN